MVAGHTRHSLGHVIRHLCSLSYRYAKQHFCCLFASGIINRSWTRQRLLVTKKWQQAKGGKKRQAELLALLTCSIAREAHTTLSIRRWIIDPGDRAWKIRKISIINMYLTHGDKQTYKARFFVCYKEDVCHDRCLPIPYDGRLPED